MIYTYIYIHVYTYIYVYIYVIYNIFIYVIICINSYMYIHSIYHIYICIYIMYMCKYTYIYIYTYAHISPKSNNDLRVLSRENLLEIYRGAPALSLCDFFISYFVQCVRILLMVFLCFFCVW